MTIEIALLVAIVGLAFSIYHGNSNLKIKQKKQSTEEISQLTMIMSKLELISTGVTEIKSDMNSMRLDIKENRESIVDLNYALRTVKDKQDDCQGYYRKKILLKKGASIHSENEN